MRLHRVAQRVHHEIAEQCLLMVNAIHGQFFCRLTDPVVAAIALVTPKAAPPVVIWLFGVVWLFWLRVGLLYLVLLLGGIPRSA